MFHISRVRQNVRNTHVSKNVRSNTLFCLTEISMRSEYDGKRSAKGKYRAFI